MASPKSYDAIVVGAGMGGLTAGALLAKKGWRVLILEKEDQPGGYVVSFRRRGFTFDATGAFVGGCHEGGEFYQILKEVDAHEAVEFIPIEEIHNVYPGFEIRLERGGFSSYIDQLRRLFPGEERGLTKYLRLVKRIGEEMEAYAKSTLAKRLLLPFSFRYLLRFHRATHQKVLDPLFESREIKMALHTLPATEPPSRLSFLFVAALLNKALMEGVFYPKGGMGRLPEAMVKALVRYGGEILFRNEVDQILIKDGKVQGLLTKGGEVFLAPLILSNINPNHLIRRLPREFRGPFERRARRFEYSLSCFILYLATDLNLKELKVPYFTYLRSISDLEEEYRMMRRGEVPKNPTLIVTVPTILDPSLAPEGKHVLKVLALAPYAYRETWGRKDPAQYREVKETFCRQLIQQLESKLIPGLSDHLLFYEAATPLTLERYTGNEQGAMYGLASTPEQIGPFRPSHRTAIPGLYQVGHYTRPSHGIVGASLSGLFAARALSQRRKRP
ncbi:MAG: NAD(P)/FAD-dependent oxidoreductase [Desulfobacterota bacterium]|nr:NAD(P)/FAD-dependent oxidoreductase [Thermodesulfobacteriota bacterium]